MSDLVHIKIFDQELHDNFMKPDNLSIWQISLNYYVSHTALLDFDKSPETVLSLRTIKEVLESFQLLGFSVGNIDRQDASSLVSCSCHKWVVL